MCNVVIILSLINIEVYTSFESLRFEAPPGVKDPSLSFLKWHLVEKNLRENLKSLYSTNPDSSTYFWHNISLYYKKYKIYHSLKVSTAVMAPHNCT